MAPPPRDSYRSRSRSRSPPPRRPQPSSSSHRDSRDRDYDQRRGGPGGGSSRRDDYDNRRDRRTSRSRSHSPPPRKRDLSPGRPSLQLDKRDRERERERERERGPLPSQHELVTGAGAGGVARGARGGAEGDGQGAKEPVKPIEPNFAPSGALAAETNTLRGVVLKYNEPPEARKPVKNWRMYVFKGKEQVDLIHVHRQSAYLLGRDRIVVDIPIDHPSTSKQHAVLQFRQVVERNEFGDTKSVTKPYIIDLDSANGTLVNDSNIPASRYYEVKSGDVLKFAFSTREYVLLAE